MKNNYFELSIAQQRTVLEQTAIKLSLPKQAVEKDLWVSAILQVLFCLPCSDSLVFKGGTSLSKVWNLISRFSEDIDIAINRAVFGYDGKLSKNRVSKLRKSSSIFVRDTLFAQLNDAIQETPLKNLCQLEPQPNGEGDLKYPEPRCIYVYYDSIFADKLDYIPPMVKVEAGSRSLLEPTEEATIHSMVEKAFPNINTTIADTTVRTAIPEKTFLEKAFLLHELFSVNNQVEAKRRSRHMYDLHMMMKHGIAERAISDGELWETIRQHRSMLTSMTGVDYSIDIRKHIQLIPPSMSLNQWKMDYEDMSTAMIYGVRYVFAELMESMNWLELLFKRT